MNTDLAAQHSIDRLDRHGFGALSEIDQTLVTAWLTEAGVGNSGFARFFSSKRGDVAFYAPTALTTIGATQLSAIAAAANAAFGPAGPPHDHKTRSAQVAAFDQPALQRLEALEEQYFSCTEDIDELLETFLAARKHETR